MSLVFIGLGSNLGNGKANIRSAWQRLGKMERITPLSISSPYLTEPVGMESAQLFTNAVGVLETRLTPQDLLEKMLAVEQAMGRDRANGMDRTIDLDILYYDDIITHDNTLTIPHPDLHKRLFVLAPMEELAPDHPHPENKLTTAQMRRRNGYDQYIKKIPWETE